MFFWDKISNIGLKSNMDSDTIRKVKLVNRILFISTLITFLIIPLSIVSKSTFAIVSQIATGIILCLLYFFSYYGKHEITILLMTLVLTCNMTQSSINIPHIGVDLFLFPVSVLSYAIIRNAKLAILVFIMGVSAYVSIEYVDESLVVPPSITQNVIDMNHYFNCVMAFVANFFLIYLIKDTNNEYETTIIKQKEIIEEHNEEIKASITYAQRIQEAILPSKELLQEHLPNSFMLYQPKDIVAGDFYWMELKGDKIYVAVADCTGHGVPGAMVSVVCHNALNRAVREFNLNRPGEILDKTRELVVTTFNESGVDVKDGMDIGLFCYSPIDYKLEFAGANNGMYVVQDHELIEIKPDKQPVGKFEGFTAFTTNELQLKKGDCIYLFTDGFADQFGGPKGKKFKYKPFKELLLEHHKEDFESQKIQLQQAITDWMHGYQQIDDICIFGMRI